MIFLKLIEYLLGKSFVLDIYMEGKVIDKRSFTQLTILNILLLPYFLLGFGPLSGHDHHSLVILVHLFLL